MTTDKSYRKSVGEALLNSLLGGKLNTILIMLLVGVWPLYTGEPTKVAFFANFMLAPSPAGTGRGPFEQIALPFFYRSEISPSGPTIRLVGAASENSSDPETAIWEISQNGGVWTKLRSLPIDAHAVFVSGETWGYVERKHPRYITVFENAGRSPLRMLIADDLVIDDSVPLIWLEAEKAVILSVAKAGVWTTNDLGVSVNTEPPGKWMIAKMSIESRQIMSMAAGQKPALSPDQKVLAFLRNGELRLLDMDTRIERAGYKPKKFGGAVKSMFWLAGSAKLIFNIRIGSESFGWRSRCAELDLNTNASKDIWTADQGCSAAVNTYFFRR